MKPRHRSSNGANTIARICLALIFVFCFLPHISPAAYAGAQGDRVVLNTEPDGDAPAAPLAKKRVFLPLMQRPVPTVAPSAPVLSPIVNPSQASSYDVTWSAASEATSYILKENGVVIYEGPNTTRRVTGKAAGHYCYDVTATNAAGASPASNSVCTDVAAEAIPRPGYWRNSAGSQWFTVSADRLKLVPGIRLSIPACGATVEIELTSGATINATTHKYSWSGSYYGSGAFSSATAAGGRMGLSNIYIWGCGYVTAGPYDTTYAWQRASVAGTEALPATWVAPDDGGPQAGTVGYTVTIAQEPELPH